MSSNLVLHPSAQSSAAARLSVSADAVLKGRNLILSYKIESPLATPKIVWPLAEMAVSSLSGKHRKDELWKTTCLEAFLLFQDGTYIEFNFGPNGEWNAYSFDSYREGMKPESRIGRLTEFESVGAGDLSPAYKLKVKVDLAESVSASLHFRLGLACVIETEGGERSYWCLKHAGEKPDFHDSRGQILEMRI